MRNPWLGACLVSLVAASALPQPTAHAALDGPVNAETLSDEHVVESMKKAADYLLGCKGGDGTWENLSAKVGDLSFPGGTTAYVTYALLHAGHSMKDLKEERLRRNSPELKPAIDYLKKLKTDMTYVKAYQLAVLAQLPHTDENKALTRQQAAPLVSYLVANGAHSYRLDAASNKKHNGVAEWDNSNTQLALLGIWEIANAGIEVKNDYWSAMATHWRKCQETDGSWAYAPQYQNHSPAAMTAAGVASMFILQDQLDLPRNDKTLKAGLDWLERRFDAGDFLHGGAMSATSYYYMYCLERVGLAAGRKYINKQDWYRYGAAKLINKQGGTGAWSPDPGAVFQASNSAVSTATALIFLARGRNPVAFNKLQYPGDTWDARPRDVANVTAWMAKSFERAINWQIVNIAARPEDWSDSAILLITGSRDPGFSDEDVRKIGEYIAAGGMVFSVADDGSVTFTKAMQKYASKISQGKYDLMRPLPADHVVYRTWTQMQPMRLQGLSNGAREIWIHSPQDLGLAWQRRAYATKDNFTIAANVYFYAAGGSDSLAPRLKCLRVVGDDETPAGERIYIARLEYPGNWDPEPGAWSRFAKVMRQDGRVDMNVSTLKAENLDKNIRIAHLTGTAAFTLGDASIQKLKAFLDGGGTLIIDGCGGRDAFDRSAKALCVSLTKKTPDVIPQGHSVYAGDFAGGSKIETIRWRRDPQSRQPLIGRPALQGVEINGRYTIIYSREDLTSGLLGTSTQGISGYAPASAAQLMRNAVLYAAKNSGRGSQAESPQKMEAPTPPPPPDPN